MKVYRCAHCGNIVFHLHDAGVPVFCCGQKMELLVPGSVDAAAEKHVPAVTVEGSRVLVQVGSVEHPMIAEHYIEWIAVETDKGVSVKWLKAGDAPQSRVCSGRGREGRRSVRLLQPARPVARGGLTPAPPQFYPRPIFPSSLSHPIILSSYGIAPGFPRGLPRPGLRMRCSRGRGHFFLLHGVL